ncbi:MAG TPA: sigma-70 family RNA polymerase sigma factor [Solirubrobacteraceae bacterium]
MLGSASPAPATTEDELIDAARIGDDRAFEELYARYRDRIGIFIRSRIRDYARAEDVAQDVFISALRRLRSSDQHIVFKPWIYEIAKNACIDEYRRNQRIREVSLEGDEEFSDGYGGMLWAAPTPPAAMESKQKLDDLRGAFGGLSDSHHQLLVMREFEGLSYDEIGRRTGMSRQMVESALFRARRKLGIEYEELASGRRCLQVQTAIEGGKLNSPRALGIRERRQLARHLAHCQPCRVTAHLAGVDESFVRTGVAAKIAALLPFPLLRLWPFGRAARGAALRTGSHPGLQAAAGTLEPGTSTLLGGAAVAVVAIAITGSGGPPSLAHRPAQPVKATTAAAYTAAAAQSISSQRDFAPGLGPGNTSPRVNATTRLMRLSAVGAAPNRYQSASRRSGSSTEMGGRPAPTRSGKPAATSGTAAAPTGGSSSSPAVPGAPGVSRTVGAAQQVVQHPVQTVTKALNPVVKTVSKVVSSVPSLPTGSSGSTSSGSSSSAVAPASTVGNVPGTVNSVTKKLGSAVGTLLTNP